MERVLIGAMIGITGCALVALSDPIVLLGVFLMMWGNNIQAITVERHSSPRGREVGSE